MMFPYGVVVTRLRAKPKTDYYSGEPSGLDWSTPDRLAISGCALAPVSSSEAPTVDREKLFSLATLYAPYSADIRASDRIKTCDGLVWEVIGHPQKWRSPFTGWEAGMVVDLERIEVQPSGL